MEDATKQNDVQPLKRKAGSNSPLPEEEAKRSKVDEDVVPDQPRNGSRKADKSESSKDEQAQRATQSPLDRRKSISQEEKKRGQRLFGSLLSTLSQTTTNSQQKRRKEIEKRQQGRAQTQRIEEDKHRSGDSVKLQNAREISQLELDEKVVRSDDRQLRDIDIW